MHEQYLLNYKHDFENDPRWLIRESSHYIFHYFPDSAAEKEIETIEKRQEVAYKKILDFLKVEEPKRKIEYYLYPDEQTKTALMGDSWYAQSVYKEFRIHVLYTEEIKPIGEHEDTHLLSLPWGLSIGIFQEGLGEYMVGLAWDGKPHTEYVKKGYKQNIFSPLSQFMEHKAWTDTDDEHAIYFYSLAGSFITFLVVTWGKKNFEKLYRETDRSNSGEKNSEIFFGVYKKSIEEVEREFKKYIKTNPTNYLYDTTEPL